MDTKTPANQAAYLASSKNPHLEVKPAPYTKPGTNEILVQNHAVAMNPLDYKKVELGEFLYEWIKYPFVLGEDVSGQVIEVGASVTRFKPGDRVVGYATGMEKFSNTSARSAFQLYTILQEHMVSPIPSSLSYEDACVMPLGLCTAACGLFQDDMLALDLPSLDPKPKNQTVIIWGGSTSVGSNAIQLAVSAGYEVITTCSPRNFEYVKSLGASQVFDYNAPNVVAAIIAALTNKTLAGALTIGSNAADSCLSILSSSSIRGKKFIAMVDYPVLDPLPTTLLVPRLIFHFVTWSAKTWVKCKLRGIGWKFIVGSTLVENGLGKKIWGDYLPAALEKGVFKARPEPLVVGKGLEFVEKALEVSSKGVSAKKVVVSL